MFYVKYVRHRNEQDVNRMSHDAQLVGMQTASELSSGKRPESEFSSGANVLE